MSIAVVNGLFSLAGMIIGALFTHLLNREEKQRRKMRKTIMDLADQVSGYWHLEKTYHEFLKDWEGDSCPSLSQMRAVIHKDYGVYPKMTAQEAQEVKKKYS